MMIRENIELQLQTIQMFEFHCNIIPAVLYIDSNDSSEKELTKLLMEDLNQEQYNRYIFIQVLRKSKAEFLKETEKIKLQEVMKANLEAKERLEEWKQKTEYKIKMAVAQKIDNKEEFLNIITSLEVLQQMNFNDSKKLSEISDIAKQSSEQDNEAEMKDERMVKKSSRKMSPDFHASILQHSLGQIMQDDMEERVAYFREQRNKILRMKHAISDQQFQTIVENVAKERPQTAKAAQRVMSSKSNCENYG
uniref:Cilia- and flagella-associated protein 36 n=1 Tax=Loa loa TaxID=7209 RepID=A0A1I7VAU7_LOALO